MDTNNQLKYDEIIEALGGVAEVTTAASIAAQSAAAAAAVIVNAANQQVSEVVSVFSDIPNPLSPNSALYLVLEASGGMFGNQYPAGFYREVGNPPVWTFIGPNSNGLMANVSITNSVLPIEGTVDVGNFPSPLTSIEISNLPSVQHTIVDSGTITVSNPTTSVSVSNFPSPLTTIEISNFPVTQPISGSVTVSNPVTTVSVSNLPVTQPISGSISVSNFPSSQTVTGSFYQTTQPISIATMPTTPVTGSFWQTTQPISGTVTVSNPGLTDTQLRATAVPVSGTFYQATQPVSLASTTITGTVAVTQSTSPWIVNGSGYTQPVSGAFYQTTQPVSIATMPSTPVTGTFWQTTQPISGTVTANQGTSPWVTSLASTTITGTVAVTQSTSPWVTSLASTTITGNVTVVQPTGTALHVVNDASTAVIGHVITDTGSTVAVSNFPVDADALAQGSTTASQLGGLELGAVLLVAPTYTDATTNPISLDTEGNQRVRINGSILAVTVTAGAAASAVAAVATLPAVAGKYHYITMIEVTKIFMAANAASTAGVAVSTTNLPGSIAFKFGSPLGTVGTVEDRIWVPSNPLRSSAVNVATTITGTGTVGIGWCINVWYYTGA